MELNITGPATVKQREMIVRAADFFLDLLMTRRLKETLYIDLELAKGLEDREGVCGEATWEDDPVRPKDKVPAEIRRIQLLKQFLGQTNGHRTNDIHWPVPAT